MNKLNLDTLLNLGNDSPEPDLQQEPTQTHELNIMKKVNNSVLETYQEQQEMQKLASISKMELIKDIQRGKDIYALLLDAIDLIGLTTKDDAFVKQTRDDLRTIYGKALGEDTVIQNEKQRAQERLNRLKAALLTVEDADKKRINVAIKRHQDFLQCGKWQP